MNKQTTFQKLKHGQKFKFHEETRIGRGIYNGVGTKLDDNSYAMSQSKRVIGNQNIKVVTT